ncbi:TetR/AcrR family transcriptional regulator [Nocardia sp. BMG111209]|uniref:TetR/AcrR family transcriptional regulator n=1 Tax=Nocardia sp. BMG111209 TaxID=1160137 RepID=UPI000360DD8B|nr:TetR/AcrR family transcriptional regulator [Nocardia sp. BMG111209]
MLGSSSCQPRAGLRERKKEQTRRRIIEVALQLCDSQGFEATTVEQIADAADVSPRTVNRYFELKEDIILAPTEEWGRRVAVELRNQPITGNELLALRNAHLVVAELSTTDETLPFSWFQQMQRIMRASAAVRSRSMDFIDTKTAELNAALGERLGLDADSLTVRLIAATWHAVIRTGMECDSALAECPPAAAPDLMVRAVQAAYDEFQRVCARPMAAAE